MVEVVPVARPHLVRVQVLLVDPASAVPELAIALVTTGVGVGPLVHLQLSAVLEGQRVVAVPPVWLVMDSWLDEGGAGGRLRVVPRLVVRGVLEHCARSVTSAISVERSISLWDN